MITILTLRSTLALVSAGAVTTFLSLGVELDPVTIMGDFLSSLERWGQAAVTAIEDFLDPDAWRRYAGVPDWSMED